MACGCSSNRSVIKTGRGCVGEGCQKQALAQEAMKAQTGQETPDVVKVSVNNKMGIVQ